MKTLLVQDGAQALDLRECLARLGHQPVACRDLAAAKTLQGQNPCPLIVLALPRQERAVADFCRWIRREPAVSRTFILVVLDPEAAPYLTALFEAGADDVLQKPCDARAVALRLACASQQIRERLQWEETETTLHTRAQQQVALAALGQTALAQELPILTELLSNFLLHTLEVEFWRLLVWTADGQTLEWAAGFGWRPGCIGSKLPRPPANSLNGHTLWREDVIFEDLMKDTRFGAPDRVLQDHGVLSGMSVALKGKSGALGLLGAYTARRRRFMEDDLRFLEGSANVLGAALEHQRSEAEIRRQQAQVQHLQRLESVGQLAAGLAHDYNNVLTIIHGHITLVLRDSNLPPKWAASLKTALEAVERAATLSRQLLTFSRKQALELAPLDLNAVVANVSRMLERLLGEPIRLVVQPAPGLPGVQADASMIEQVIMNLAINARDAMPLGGQLTLTTGVEQLEGIDAKRHPSARPGEFVYLLVRDNGCGMDEATLRRIFEPFFTTKGPTKGTGLGLATVFGIVQQHQGWIEVESILGQGTTFRIWLPSLGRRVAAATVPTGVTAAVGGNETILLVEDEAALRALARLLLEDLGYQVLEAGSGREALKVWEEQGNQVQVLLTDLVMPDGVSGFELAERLQQKRANLRVILASGYSVEELRQRQPAKASFHFIQKPYRTETLAQTIRQALAEAG